MTQKFPPSRAEWLEKHSMIKDIERNVLGCGKQDNGPVLTHRNWIWEKDFCRCDYVKDLEIESLFSTLGIIQVDQCIAKVF